MKVHAEISIQARPAQVFPWIAEPEKAMLWQEGVESPEILAAAPGMVGTTFRETVADGNGRLEMTGEIASFVPNEEIGFHLRSRIHELDVRYATRPEPETAGTLVTVDADIKWKFPVNLLAVVMGGRMRRGIAEQLGRELAHLKQLCEGERVGG